MKMIATANDNALELAAMERIEIVPARAAHVHALARVLRREDEHECVCFGLPARRVLWKTFKNSLTKKTAFIDGTIAAMWGVGGILLGQTGRPWLLTGLVVEEIPALTFARIYRREVAEMLKLFPRLENIVDASYDKSVRMLGIAGFTLDEPRPVGSGSFRSFWREA